MTNDRHTHSPSQGIDPGGNDEAAYRQRARAWLEANLPRQWRGDQVDFTAPSFDACRDWERRLHGAGLAGITWPTEYGGHGLSLREHMIANEEIGRLAGPESVNSFAKEMAGPIMLGIGTEAQKRRFLANILTMQEIWCQGFSEPDAGSDLAGLRTRATRDDNGWRIDGQKIWTSNAHNADWCLLLARTGPAEHKHNSLTLFTVPLRQPGVTIQPIQQITGHSGFNQVFYDGARVPPDGAVGEVNAGWRAAVSVLEIERATNRMYRTNRFENEFNHLLRVCRGDAALRTLLADRHYRQRLAATFADIEVLRRHVRAAVASILRGGGIGGAGSFIKLHWSEAHQRFVELAMELLDQAPVPASPEVAAARRRFEGAYLAARAETIYAGSSQVQLNIIADRVLRLPRER